MSIPLDRLYNYLESLCSDDIIIYRWSPHGSKKLEDLTPLITRSWIDMATLPPMIAHDQEPLDFDFFEQQERLYFCKEYIPEYQPAVPNLRQHAVGVSIYDKHLLCHSEKNSPELEKFKKFYIGVYYWSHALIARDWFRFAQLDRELNYNPHNYKHDFLIYSRAWSGSREYRLKFTELLLESKLIDCSLTSFAPVDSNIYYSQHSFKNSKFTITNFTLEENIPLNTFSPCSSADYVSEDYNSCGIEIVLETLFDDQRHHLTEKTLRSIACGKPFILAATSGSLEYLKSYGFKTFNGLINESYDQLTDPLERLTAIVNEMKRIHNLPEEEKVNLYCKLNEIAEYNKTLFFSHEWHQTIVDEFVSNFNVAYAQLPAYRTGKIWAELKAAIDRVPLARQALDYDSEGDIDRYVELVKQLTEFNQQDLS